MRQVRHQTDVRLLSKLGAQVGISTQEHPRGDSTLFGRHHQPSSIIIIYLLCYLIDDLNHLSHQEVETEQFYNYFLPELKRDGYDGIFSPKSRAKTMAESDRRYVDGCAIFYRTAK